MGNEALAHLLAQVSSFAAEIRRLLDAGPLPPPCGQMPMESDAKTLMYKATIKGKPNEQ